MIYSPSPTFKILPLVQVNFDEAEIDIQSIRNLCSDGLSINCPPEDRALAWLNLLSIYPANPQHWATVCKTILKSYNNFTTNFSLKNSATDEKLINCIKSDIKRSKHQLYYLINRDGNKCRTLDEEMELEAHMKRIERILFIFAKVNPKLSYIQGFNELIIPIYYVMHSAINIFFENIDYVEAISYEAFQFLFISSDLKDFFNINLSLCENKISPFDQLLNRQLPKTYKKLKLLNIKSIQYAYKWFNIMFSQEHSLLNLLPLWDSLFAHLNNLSLFEYCIGVARIMAVHKKIEYDYPDIKSKYSLKNNSNDVQNGYALGQILSILCNIRIPDIYSLIKQANIIFNNISGNSNGEKNKILKHFFSHRHSSLH